FLVNHGCDHVACEPGSAARGGPDDVEGPEAADQGEDDDGRRRPSRKRDRDLAQDLPWASAVYPCRLEVLAGNGDDAGHDAERRDADALPDVDRRDRVDGEVWISEPTRLR